MSRHTHETAPTQSAQVEDIRLTYRRFGTPDVMPLLLLNHFAANMDDWNPKITNGFAAEREVIFFDDPGVGRSIGETPSTVAAMTKDCLGLCRALDVNSFDVVGLSLGDVIAQQLASDHPGIVQRVVLLGTGPRGGEGMTFTELSADELGDPVALLMHAFFIPGEASQAASRAYIERLKLRVADRDAPVSGPAAAAELAAIREWGAIPSTDRFAMLGRIHQPTLVVHGSKDVVVMPINAFLLAEHLPYTQFIMYPDASHCAQSQHAEVVLQHARLFLAG